jgi:hypothetical protein
MTESVMALPSNPMLIEFGGLALLPASFGGDGDLAEKLSFPFDVGQKGLVITVHCICTARTGFLQFGPSSERERN